MWIYTERQPHSEAKSHNKDVWEEADHFHWSFSLFLFRCHPLFCCSNGPECWCWRDVLDINFGSVHLHFLWKMYCYLWILLEPTPEVVFYLYILPIGGIFIIIFSFMCSQLSSSVFRCFSLIFQVQKVPSDWNTSHLAEAKWCHIFRKSYQPFFSGVVHLVRSGAPSCFNLSFLLFPY